MAFTALTLVQRSPLATALLVAVVAALLPAHGVLLQRKAKGAVAFLSTQADSARHGDASAGQTMDPGFQLMNRTLMQEHLLPKQSKHVNNETVTSDWLEEYDYYDTAAPENTTVVATTTEAPPKTHWPFVWTGAQIAAAALLGAAVVLVALYFAQ
eukprot:CAMPEP_0115242880 /NCGR_PEP_ID=MMETSP0270-20121206/39183_1 /TAXON_ID=71861 /ORGANISM="Scrippsiella trochoidea, Strain CCMP3099" /LENGTH=154 /DNA_ID=CAMNT_0002657965 /DNA_START=8 /DNA_END=469 /DNA_ORIENTATION=+